MSSPVGVGSTSSPSQGQVQPSHAQGPPLPGESPYIRVSSLKKTGGVGNNVSTNAEIYQQIKSSSNSIVQGSKSSSSGGGGGGGHLSGSLSLPPVQLLSSTNFNNSTTISNQPDAEENPFVVTVRQSPGGRISKSSSGSYIIGGGRSGNKSPGGTGAGPRLALYRSNSSLDLLDRDNYLLHHHQRIGVGGGGGGVYNPQGYGGCQQQVNVGPGVRTSIGVVGHSHSHAHQEVKGTSGCFPRRKDFGSHGSIDMLSTTSGGGGGGISSGGFKTERSGSLGNSQHFLSLLTTTGNSSVNAKGGVKGGRMSESEVIGKKGEGDKGGNGGGGKGPLRESASPRLKLKLQRLWEHKETKEQGVKNQGVQQQQTQERVVGTATSNKSEASIFRKLRGVSSGSSATGANSRAANAKSLPEGVKFEVLTPEEDEYDGGKVTLRHEKQTQQIMEERFRRRVFAHFDCQSVSANISCAARLRCILSKRRNTTTGASAASLSTRPSSHSNGGGGGGGLSVHHLSVVGGGGQPSSLDVFSTAESTDQGDDKSNALVLSCPYFRNETGGEKERLVPLSRLTTTGGVGAGGRGSFSSRDGLYALTPTAKGNWDENCHRSFQARGISLLEWPSGGSKNTHWTNSHCPLTPFTTTGPGSGVQGQSLLEAKDLGASYYRRHFHSQDHENWFGLDENLGPLAISVKKERVEETDKTKNLYRVIVRSTELNTLRGSILEESIPGVKANSTKVNSKELIEFLLPEVTLSCLKLGTQSRSTEDQLLKLDEQGLTHRHKVGVMYCKPGQSSEEEMYNNEVAGPAFEEFLDLIGQRIRLKGFDKYTGGLDNKDDSTGLHSVYSTYEDCEVIFHVSTLLPFTPNNRQQLMRKRHIGNDIVTIVFQEPGALPFTPKTIRSQFQHVFIVVRAINPNSDSTHYTVSVSRSREVPLFGPPIPQGAKFPKNKDFVQFLLAKVINAENATYRSEKFTTMATRTRQEYLKDLVANYSTNSPIDPRPKFSMLQFGNKKKEMGKPKFNGDGVVRGALSWAVWVEEGNTDSRLDAYLAISTDSIVIIDAASREPIVAIACLSVLGWNSSMSNRLRIYFHQGECVTIRGKGESDELLEIVTRLEAVTKGSETLEYVLRRSEGTQLGFHVQQDGVITEVEPTGCAAKSGLKQGSRLVEICKVVVATLTQDEMIEMLKTPSAVVLMVVPPFPDNSPRRGCIGAECSCTRETEREGTNSVNELYENIHLNGRVEGGESPSHPHTHFKQNPHRKKYEPRGFSPPRSSNSSGYGTGSSSKSFNAASIEQNLSAQPTEGETLTSSSSGVSSGEERWYDITDTLKDTHLTTPSLLDGGRCPSPPPIPARNTPHSSTNSCSSPPTRQSPAAGRTPSSHNSKVVQGLNNNGTPLSSKPFILRGKEVEYFQRSSPHHNSFHTKLSPSRSHDTLHLKNLYGLNQPLRPFPSASVGPDSKGFERSSPAAAYNNNGALRGFSVGGVVHPHGKLTREHSSLGVPGEVHYNMGRNNGSKSLYGTPLENTVRGKVTYLTDFPQGVGGVMHSHSTEHIASVGLPLQQNKDLTALKNERVAALKSAYLEKHRVRDKPLVGGFKTEQFRPIVPAPSAQNSHSKVESSKVRPVSLPLTPTNYGVSGQSLKGTPSSSEGSVKLRSVNGSGGGGGAGVRVNLNRSSTLQEDLLRLIGPDSLRESEEERSKGVHLQQKATTMEGPSQELYSKRALVPGASKAYQEPSVSTKRFSYDERGKRDSLLLDPPSVEADLRFQEVSPTHGQRLTSSRLSNNSKCMNSWLQSQGDSELSEGGGVSPIMPIESVLNLEARVSQLEAELRKEQESKEVLAVTVASLQQENRRLQQESHSTQQQFSQFKEWLLHSVDPANPSSHS